MTDLVSVDDFLESPEEDVTLRLALRDPDRVVKLEWRCVNRPETGWLTCHSLIEAHLLDGRRLRLQKYSNRGFVVSSLASSEVSTEGAIYKNLQVSMEDFAVKVLLVDELWCIASEIGAVEYCLASANCHHFARDLWNRIVSGKHKQSTYPDRVKSALLSGAKTLSLDQLGTKLVNNDMFCADLPSDEDDLEADFESGWRMTLQKDENGRFSGSICSPRTDRPSYNQAGRLQDFCRLVEAGAVHILDVHSNLALTPLQAPKKAGSTEDRCEVWPQKWLQDAGEVGARLAERITGTDVANLVLRLPEDKLASEADEKREMPSKKDKKGATLNALFGSIDFRSADKNELIQDLCFVVLRSPDQLRLAIYAILRPLSVFANDPFRYLRLVSGNANENEEGSLTYVLRDLPSTAPLDESLRLSSRLAAAELLRGEETALRTALSTGDWGFITLL